MADLKGKIALVTGARKGIGHAIAVRLASAGACVVTAQREPCKNFETLECDLEDFHQAEVLIDRLIKLKGRIDILVNNAGLMREARVDQHSFADWQTTIAVNLTAPFLLIRSALPHLADVGGTIINLGSVESTASNPGHAAYCASKAGLDGLTRAVAVDAGPLGVRCNTVAPGWIDTDLNDAFVAQQPGDFSDKLAKLHPVGRTGKPEDIAELVAYLVSEQANFVTGQVFSVDGGRTSKLPLP